MKPQTRDEICRVGRSLFERGYAHYRRQHQRAPDDGYLITPTDACLGTLQPERLAPWTQRPAGGGRPDQQDHCTAPADYEASASTAAPARCVIHRTAHTWWAARCKPTPLQTGNCRRMRNCPPSPYFVMKVGRVPHPTAQAMLQRLRWWHRPSPTMPPGGPCAP